MFKLSRKQLKQFAVLIAASLFIGLALLLNANQAVPTPMPQALTEHNAALAALSCEETKPSEVVINEASYEALVLCPQIGKKSAEKILSELKYGRFRDWRDLKDRADLKSNVISALIEAGVRLERAQ